MGADNTFGETNFNPDPPAKKVQWSGYGPLGNVSQKPLPPAEGAEKPNAMKFLSDNGYGSGFNYTTNQVAYLMEEFATLHAQRIADKMVDAKTSRNGC